MDATQQRWDAVDDWIERHLVPEDTFLTSALAASADAGLPAIQVSPAQGRMLELLVRMTNARFVLEVGTLGGYSTIWLARGLPTDGRVVTLELDLRHAEVARGNLAAAGLSDKVEVRVGAASALLGDLHGQFDLVFIDADKASTPEYFSHALRLSHPGTIIVVDNVVRGGAVVDDPGDDVDVAGIRRFVELVGLEPRVRSTAIQTVGRKGYDGFAVLLVGE